MHEDKEGQGILTREQEWRKVSFHGQRKDEASYLESNILGSEKKEGSFPSRKQRRRRKQGWEKLLVWEHK